jgi:hypothetical protein
MDFRRTVKCSNCAAEATFNVSSDLELKELVLSGKCRCGSTIQATYNIVSQSGSPPYEPPKTPEPSGPSPEINIDESLFGADMPSDTLRDIMED